MLANPIPCAQFCLSNCKLDGELNSPRWKRRKHKSFCPSKIVLISVVLTEASLMRYLSVLQSHCSPGEQPSFCSTNWSTGALLTLPLAWLAWEQQPAASQTSNLLGRLCCKPHLLPWKGTRIAWKDPSESLGLFYLTFPVTR